MLFCVVGRFTIILYEMGAEQTQDKNFLKFISLQYYFLSLVGFLHFAALSFVFFRIRLHSTKDTEIISETVNMTCISTVTLKLKIKDT